MATSFCKTALKPNCGVSGMKKMTFALCFGNRGFMPGELITGVRKDMAESLTKAGYDCLFYTDQN
jgi:hypothetical protein